MMMLSLLSGHTVKTNLKIFCFKLILSTHVFSLTVIIQLNVFSFFDVSVSVDNSGSSTTDLYVKPTDTHQYLLATS